MCLKKKIFFGAFKLLVTDAIPEGGVQPEVNT